MHGDALDDAGVVDQDVDLSHLYVDALHERLDIILLGHVADIARDIGDAGFLVVGEAPLQSGFVDVVEDDVVDAGGDESFRDVEADAVGSARDPGVLSFKRKRVCHDTEYGLEVSMVTKIQ